MRKEKHAEGKKKKRPVPDEIALNNAIGELTMCRAAAAR